MKQYQIMLHRAENRVKPSAKEYGKFRIANQLSKVAVTLTELAKYMEKGHVFYPSIHHSNDKINAYTFVSQELIGIDFDNNEEEPVMLSLEEHVARIKEYGFDVAVAYKTQSYTEQMPKFRFIFVLDKVYTAYSEELFNGTYAFYQMFNHGYNKILVDTKCNEAARLFNGGLYNATAYVNEQARPVNLHKAIQVGSTLSALPTTKKERVVSSERKERVQHTSTDFAGFELMKAFKPEELAKYYQAKNDFVPTAVTPSQFMNQLKMDELYDFPINSRFLDVFHDEETPSANVYRNKVDMYNCFSDSAYKTGYTNAKLISEVHGVKAYDFMVRFMKAFNKDVLANPLKSIVESNSEFVESERFQTLAPNAYKVFSNYRFGYRLMTVQHAIASHTEGATMVEGQINAFFSLRKIVEATRFTRAASSEASACELMAFATLLGYTKKHADVELTKEAKSSLDKQRQRTAMRKGQKDAKRLSVYSFVDLASLTDEELQEMDQKSADVIRKGISCSKMSKALIIGAYGEEKAKEIYPTEFIKLSAHQAERNHTVESFIKNFVKQNGFIYKKIVMDHFKGKIYKKQLENAYIAAIEALGYETESATKELNEKLGTELTGRTKVSYPKTEEKELSAFMTELLSIVDTEETTEIIGGSIYPQVETATIMEITMHDNDKVTIDGDDVHIQTDDGVIIITKEDYDYLTSQHTEPKQTLTISINYGQKVREVDKTLPLSV